jgi:transcriptional regulator with XRE-family HTH domain
MSSAIQDFERDCSAAGVSAASVLRRAGLNPSNWSRWKSGDVSPTLRSFEAARAALRSMVNGHGGVPGVDDETLTGPGGEGAENFGENVSRTVGVAA